MPDFGANVENIVQGTRSASNLNRTVDRLTSSLDKFGDSFTHAMKAMGVSNKEIVSYTRNLKGYRKEVENITESERDLTKRLKDSEKGYQRLTEKQKKLIKELEELAKAQDLVRKSGGATEGYLSGVAEKSKKLGYQLSLVEKRMQSLSNDTVYLNRALNKLHSSGMWRVTQEGKKAADVLKEQYAKALDVTTVSAEKQTEALDKLTAADRIQFELKNTQSKITEAMAEGEIETARELAEEETVRIKALKLLTKYNYDYATAIDKARNSETLAAKAKTFLTKQSTLQLTAGGLALATYNNATRQVRQSLDLLIASGKELPDTFGKGVRQVGSDLWKMSGAMNQVTLTAIKLGLDVDQVRDNFTYLSRELRITDVGTLAKLTDRVTTLSRVMGVDTTKVIDAMRIKMLKMGQTVERATDDYAAIYENVTQVNSALGDTIVRLDDVAEMTTEAATSSTAYAQNTRMMSDVITQSIITLQRQGRAYDAAKKGAQSFINMIQRAPDWMKWKAGQSILANLQDPKNLEAAKKAYPEIASQIDFLVRKGGPAAARMLAEVMSDTTLGAKAMLGTMQQVQRVDPTGYVLGMRMMNMTAAEATDAAILMQETAKTGFDNFISGLDISYEEAKRLSEQGIEPLAERLGITDERAKQLSEDLKGGSIAGLSALKRLRLEHAKYDIDQVKSAKNLIKAGELTDKVSSKAQKGMTAYAVFQGNIGKNIKAFLEDNPLITGIGAMAFGGGAMLGKLSKLKGATEGDKAIVKELRGIHGTLVSGKLLGGVGKLLPGKFTAGAAGLARGLAAPVAATALGYTAGKVTDMIAPAKTERADKAGDIGALIGTGVVGAIGTAIGGPVGMMIGAAIGGSVGELTGRWVSTWGEAEKEAISAIDQQRIEREQLQKTLEEKTKELDKYKKLGHVSDELIKQREEEIEVIKAGLEAKQDEERSRLKHELEIKEGQLKSLEEQKQGVLDFKDGLDKTIESLENLTVEIESEVIEKEKRTRSQLKLDIEKLRGALKNNQLDDEGKKKVRIALKASERAYLKQFKSSDFLLELEKEKQAKAKSELDIFSTREKLLNEDIKGLKEKLGLLDKEKTETKPPETGGGVKMRAFYRRFVQTPERAIGPTEAAAVRASEVAANTAQTPTPTAPPQLEPGAPTAVRPTAPRQKAPPAPGQKGKPTLRGQYAGTDGNDVLLRVSGMDTYVAQKYKDMMTAVM